jgi:hypothetical protein
MRPVNVMDHLRQADSQALVSKELGLALPPRSLHVRRAAPGLALVPASSRRAAGYVDRVRKVEKPADRPDKTPTNHISEDCEGAGHHGAADATRPRRRASCSDSSAFWGASA